MSQITVRSVAYQIDGLSYESRLAFDADHKRPRPGLLNTEIRPLRLGM